MKAAKQVKTASPRLLTYGSNGEPTHDEIALLAYSLWEEHGHPEDQEVGLWLQAEMQLRQAPSQNVARA